jgi:rare lipoprotein A
MTIAFAACLAATANILAATPSFAEDGKTFSGNISWYGAKFNGRKTASGEKFDSTKPTAAHRKLPFQTKVLIEDPQTGKSVVVKVNDRGPFVKSRIMDVSREGARRLGTLAKGIRYVDCTVVTN